jgi:prevent-host-death family protein
MEMGIGVGQLRAAPFSYLRRVANGETLRVVRRGQLVATLDSIGNSMDENNATTGGRYVRVQVSYLRASFGRLLDRVRDGDTIEIVHRGKPLARINPVDTSSEPRSDDLSAATSAYLVNR